MGFTLKEIQESLTENRYDEVCATYMLLKRDGKEVRCEVFVDPITFIVSDVTTKLIGQIALPTELRSDITVYCLCILSNVHSLTAMGMVGNI